MRRLLFALAILVAALPLCLAGKGSQGTAALTAADRAFDKATAERGVIGFASFLAADTQTLRPDQPVISGKQAVAELWRPLLENPAQAIRWQPTFAAISRSGDLGYTLGRYQITQHEEQRPEDAARAAGPREKVISTGKYVTIWRKQRDGSWKVAFDSGVRDTTPQPVPASKP